jgi:hypothetical protein
MTAVPRRGCASSSALRRRPLRRDHAARLDDQRKANIEAIRSSAKLGIPIVVTLDEHYPTPDWAPTQDVLLMIATNQTVKKREKKREEGEDVYEFTCPRFYHQTEDEIRHSFATFHPGINQGLSTRRSATRSWRRRARRPSWSTATRRCRRSLPRASRDNVAHLRKLYEGLERRGYGGVRRVRQADGRSRSRPSFEHGVVDYMLMVWDIVEWAKSIAGAEAQEGQARLRGPRRSRSWWVPAEVRRPARGLVGDRDHQRQPDQVPAALRALPQPQPQGPAGHRSSTSRPIALTRSRTSSRRSTARTTSSTSSRTRRSARVRRSPTSAASVDPLRPRQGGTKTIDDTERSAA